MAKSGKERGTAGFTMLELTIAIGVLLVAFYGFTSALQGSMTASQGTLESTEAREAARGVLEALGGEAFDEIFARYNADPADDPDGPGSAPGRAFDVGGLEPVDGDADGRVGEVLFPVSAAAPGVLREDVVLAPLGMPRDLNGDGVVDAADHSGDYQLLPVIVRVQWKGQAGPRLLQLRTLVGNYR